MRKGLSLHQHPLLGTLLALFLADVLLAGCGLAGQRREVINYTPHTFCRLEETPNLSIYAPWDKKTRRIKLPPKGRIIIRDRGEDYIISLISCDGRYVADNYMAWPEQRGPWIVGSATDLEALHAPSPPPTRTQAVVSILNQTRKDICDIKLAVRMKPYQFNNDILDEKLSPGGQIILREPEDIGYAVYVMKIQLCDRTTYTTDAATFSYRTIITLRGEPLDNDGNLRIEHED